MFLGLLSNPVFLLSLAISLGAVVTAWIDFAAKKDGEKRFRTVLFAIALGTPILGLAASGVQITDDAKDKERQPLETIERVKAYIQVEVQASSGDLARYRQRLESAEAMCLQYPSSFRTDAQGQQTTFHVVENECLPDPDREASAAEALRHLLLDLRFFGSDGEPVGLEDLEQMEPDFSIPLTAFMDEGLELRYDVERKVFILSSFIYDESPAFTLGKNVGSTGSVEGLAGGRLLVRLVRPDVKSGNSHLDAASVELSKFQLRLAGSRSLTIPAEGESLKRLDSGRSPAYLYHFPNKIALKVGATDQ